MFHRHHTALPLVLLLAMPCWLMAADDPPVFADPDIGAILDRLSPVFRQGAGSPADLPDRTGTDADHAFPCARPEQVMPVGAGTLSAMVAYGDRLELHLSKTGLYAAVGENPWISPGHVAITFPRAASRDLTGFEQRLDLRRGSVRIRLSTADGDIAIEVAGAMRQDCLVVSVEDRRDPRPADGAIIAYENWRPGASAAIDGQVIAVTEPFANPTAQGHRKASSLAIASALACRGAPAQAVSAAGSLAAIKVAAGGPAAYQVAIAACTAPREPPTRMALDAVHGVLDTTGPDLAAERLAWWERFWSRSWLDLSGPDADRLARLWYTTLYSYACVGQGPVPPKFNGGPGLIHRDRRQWGEGYWWQNQREIIWPMDAAGHPEFARRQFDFFDHALGAALARARSWRMDGALFSEWNTPALWDGGLLAAASAPRPAATVAYVRGAASPDAALARRSDQELRGGGYTSHVFSSGPELVQLMLDHVRFTGDRDFLRTVAAPWLQATAINCLSLLTDGPDGRLHARFADANEQWWRVDDPASLISAIRWILLTTAVHGQALGFPAELVADAADRLGRLAPEPLAGDWSCSPGPNGKPILSSCTDGGRLIAPFALKTGAVAMNTENPELYPVFPFGFFDLNSPAGLLEIGRATFAHRRHPNTAAWSQCPVQAARLGLPEAVAVILDHADRHQKWPYGGWNSVAVPLYPRSEVCDCPYFDGAGVNMTALQEALLQSHPAPGAEPDALAGGPLRILPCVPPTWSGRFLLHARGGFEVRAAFADGRPTGVWIRATRDGRLRIVNPFPAARLWRNGASLGSRSAQMVELDAAADDRIALLGAQP